MDQREKRLAKAMAEQIRPWCLWARVGNVLSHSALAKLERPLAEELGYVPILQPDIDIGLKDDRGKLCAIELKVLTQVNESRSFYKGIGQALALLRYGVDYAALWLVFDDECELQRLASPAWYLLRNELALDLDFTPFLVREEGGPAPVFQIWQYKSQHEAEYTGQNLGSTRLHFRHPNPLLRDKMQTDVAIVRTHVERWLEAKLATSDRGGVGPIEVIGPVGPERQSELEFDDAGPTGPQY